MNVLPNQRIRPTPPPVPCSYGHSSQLRLPAVPSAVGNARRFTRDRLRRWELDEFAADVELIVSELLTNAIRATGTLAFPVHSADPRRRPKAVSVCLKPVLTSINIEVWDTDPTPPMPADAAELAEFGRGLILVEAISDEWGYYLSGKGGKVVWARYEGKSRAL